LSGKVSHLAGQSAEEIVATQYAANGAVCLARRWRGGGGEIDLIVELDGTLVFVEVKKSRDFGRAATRIAPAQRARLEAAATTYLAGCPRGADTDCRFDVALVDAAGRVEIVANAFS